MSFGSSVSSSSSHSHMSNAFSLPSAASTSAKVANSLGNPASPLRNSSNGNSSSRPELSPGTLSKILSEDAYSPPPKKKSAKGLISPGEPIHSPLMELQLGSPNIRYAAQLRKRHLKKASITDSPFKNTSIETYGEGPLSKRAIQEKTKKDITAGRNTAIAVFENPPGSKKFGYTTASTDGPPGGTHAENTAIDKVPRGAKKELVYTERAPCKCGSNCHCKLKAVLRTDVKIVHSVPHQTDLKRRREDEKEFQEKQEEFGIRTAKKSKKS